MQPLEVGSYYITNSNRLPVSVDHRCSLMSRIYLEVTFCDGKPFCGISSVASRKSGDKAARSKKAEAGLVVDFSADGRPIGIEITSPSEFNVDALNRVMTSLDLTPISSMARWPPL